MAISPGQGRGPGPGGPAVRAAPEAPLAVRGGRFLFSCAALGPGCLVSRRVTGQPRRAAVRGMRPRWRGEPTGPSPTGSCPGPRPFLPTPPQRPVPTSLLPCPQDLQASPTHRPIPVPPPGQCPPPGPSPLPGLSSLPVPTAPRPAQHSATEPHPLKGGPHHVAATAEVPLRACCWFLISAPKQNAGPPGGGCVHRPPWGLPAPGSPARSRDPVCWDRVHVCKRAGCRDTSAQARFLLCPRPPSL